jgi:hypothetical protein
MGSDGGAVDLLVLATSELATNAVRHGPAGGAARIAVTWGVYRGETGPDRVSVSVLDCGRGGLRIRDMASVDGLSEGQYGLPLLLRSGLRIEPVVLPTDDGRGGGHLVTAWTPVRARLRERVCACPCWEHGYGTERCQGLISGARCSVTLFGELSVVCCPPCATAHGSSMPDDVACLGDSRLPHEAAVRRLASAAGSMGWG